MGFVYYNTLQRAGKLPGWQQTIRIWAKSCCICATKRGRALLSQKGGGGGGGGGQGVSSEKRTCQSFRNCWTDLCNRCGPFSVVGMAVLFSERVVKPHTCLCYRLQRHLCSSCSVPMSRHLPLAHAHSLLTGLSPASWQDQQSASHASSAGALPRLLAPSAGQRCAC